MMSELLLTLNSLTGSNRYLETAKKTVVPFMPAYRKYPAWSAPVALAAGRLVSTYLPVLCGGQEIRAGL